MQIVEQCERLCSRDRFSDDLQPLARYARCVKKDSGHVAAWPIEALGSTYCNGVGLEVERDDWLALGSLPGSHETCRANCHYNICFSRQLLRVLCEQLPVTDG